jgi:hypothetical protein
MDNILKQEDIFFNLQRDGAGNGYAIAFVIDEEVVHGGVFTISFAKKILLNNPEFSSFYINNNEIEVLIAKTSSQEVRFVADEKLTAVLLSNCTIHHLSFPENRLVMPGWKYNGKYFYLNQNIGGIEKIINGQGEIIDG